MDQDLVVRAPHGDLAAFDLSSPIVGFAPTSSGKGYWLVGTDGGIFAFGDARFHGMPQPAVKQQVFRWVAADGQFREDDDIRAVRIADVTRVLDNARRIARDVADDQVDLCQGNFYGIAHG